MHRKSVFLADTDDGVAEDGLTAGSRDEDTDDFAILDAELLGIGWGHVDVTFGNNKAFFELNGFAVKWVDEFDWSAAGDVSALTDWGADLKGSGVGAAHFDLVLFSYWTKDRDAFEHRFFAGLWVDWSDDIKTGVAGELAWLGKWVSDFEFSVLSSSDFLVAEHKIIKGFLGNVDVPCAGFDNEF